MKSLIASFAVATLLSGTALFADTAKKPASDHRAAKVRRQIVEDLRLRGSNIPPVFTGNGKWGR